MGLSFGKSGLWSTASAVPAAGWPTCPFMASGCGSTSSLATLFFGLRPHSFLLLGFVPCAADPEFSCFPQLQASFYFCISTQSFGNFRQQQSAAITTEDGLTSFARVYCVSSTSGGGLHQRKFLPLCHCNHACASLFRRPSAHCVFVTLASAFASFLTSVAFVFPCGDLSARVALWDVPKQLRMSMEGFPRASGDDVILTKGAGGTVVPLWLGTCCPGLTAGRTAVAGGRKSRRDTSGLWRSKLSSAGWKSVAASPRQLRPRG